MYSEKENGVLRNVTDFVGNDIFATDVKIGQCSDVLFDKQEWKIRFLVVDTVDWLKDCRLLVSPLLVDRMQEKALSIEPRKSEIEKAPLLFEDDALSARNGNLQTQYPHIFRINKAAGRRDGPLEESRIDVDFLRFGNERFDLSIKASDGELGQVQDLVADCDSWKLQYLVIETETWPPRTRVIVYPSWIGKVDRYGDRVAMYLCSRRPDIQSEDLPVEAGCLSDYCSLPRYWG